MHKLFSVSINFLHLCRHLRACTPRTSYPSCLLSPILISTINFEQSAVVAISITSDTVVKCVLQEHGSEACQAELQASADLQRPAHYFGSRCYCYSCSMTDYSIAVADIVDSVSAARDSDFEVKALRKHHTPPLRHSFHPFLVLYDFHCHLLAGLETDLGLDQSPALSCHRGILLWQSVPCV